MEVINHKRYAEDKILFHCPITLNRARNCSDFKFKQKVNNFLANNSEINIIGVDRGEKHLAYYSVINQKNEILEIGSLNKINGVNYADKLDVKAREREGARIGWQKVEEIKDLRKGYISQVVKKIADLAIKHNAIIVFEDLNMRFKQIRGGIEKSVYQQLEKALIEKLNFLVEKGAKDAEKAGNLLKAYQLTAPFENFKDMGKQTGILFYTQAEYTSTTDPVSGFRKNIYISNSASIEKIKNEMKKFDEISWDEKLQSYYFKYDAREFNKNGKGESRDWIIYAKTPRIRREKENGYWNYNYVNPNDMMESLLKSFDFDLKSNIKKQIEDKEKKNELGEREFDGRRRNFYKSLVYILNLILQVRNSFSEKDSDGNEKNYIDFIASPVAPFFSTEAIDKNEKILSTANFNVFEEKFLSGSADKEKIKKEFNGDANGALNIARKGIIILNRISEWQRENEKLKEQNQKEKFFPDLFISYSDWDKFVQK
jgi:CRISPR-associated protein Cpf1